jgi:hypothetical protein
MNNPEDIIRKLLALAAGGTEHEASLAAEKASLLALKYNIDLLALQEKPSDYQDGMFSQDIRSEQWVSNIIAGVAKLNAVKHYRANQRDGSVKYRLIGRPHNIAITQDIAHYLINEVKRLNRVSVQSKSCNKEERSAYRKAFRLSASQRLYARLIELFDSLNKKDQPIPTLGCTALVVANYFQQETDNIAEFMKSTDLNLVPKKSRGISIKSSEGWNDGKDAGNKISLNTQVKGPAYGAARIAK